MHGEVGQTQFLPKTILEYGTGNLDVAANALNSTANFLKAHGWRAGAGYQPGEAEFRGHRGLERRAGLSEGDRADGPADRRRVSALLNIFSGQISCLGCGEG